MDLNDTLRGQGEDSIRGQFDLAHTQSQREGAALLDDVAAFLGRALSPIPTNTGSLLMCFGSRTRI